MFQIGEFARIAHISTRQLRHYDELGLFKPAHIDSETGYRYYSAKQLPQLNRLLVLKELGLSLDQIALFLHHNLSAGEMHSMLMLKKAQIEQKVEMELQRIRSIEERLQQIENQGEFGEENVIVKSIPAQKFLAIRQIIPSIKAGFTLMYEIHRLLAQTSHKNVFGNFGVMLHSEGFDTKELDTEMGFLSEVEIFDTLKLGDDRYMQSRDIPAMENVATFARIGLNNEGLSAYATLATWIEKHNYSIAAPVLEIFVQPFQVGKEAEAVIEIQYPIQKKHKELRTS